MKQTIYYAGFYDTINSTRRYSTPAVAKMNYIIYALNQAGYDVNIISPSYIKNNKKYEYEKGGYKTINNNATLWLPPSFGMKSKFGKYCSALISLACWFLKLLDLKKDDTLIVYHSLTITLPIRIAKKIKKFSLIVEIEEIYTYAFKETEKTLRKEMKLIKATNKHIIVNDLISELIGIENSNKVICYGPYKIDTNSKPIEFGDDKIHIVYAGSFSLYKGGVKNAIIAARYLPSSYVMHILGYGTINEIREVKNLIYKINLFKRCEVRYEGLKHGEEYYVFMKSCQIGLNPQKWGEYMHYAYPSKILVYLCLGLNVVTSPLKSITSSSLNSYFNYILEETPQSIAQAILNIEFYSSNELKNAISHLNIKFIKDLAELIRK